MNEDKLFLGNSSTNTRTYLHDAFRTLREKRYYKKLVIPCCGQLSTAMAALQAGWQPDQIYASDVSLFSTVLARSINRIHLEDLEITINGEPWAGSHAELLYWLKYYTALNQSKQYFQSVIVRDLRERKAAHIENISNGLEKFEALRGFHYRMYDLFDEVAEALQEPGTVIWCNPPFYKRGYERMFDTGGKISWNEPEFKEFDPRKDHDALRDGALEKPALYIWSCYNELKPGDKEYAVFCEQKGPARWDYTLCSRPEELDLHTVGRQVKNFGARLAILPSTYQITKDSKIGFKAVTPADALYYRDLFVHKLGVTNCSHNYIMVIDNYVSGVVGFSSIEKIQRDAFDAHSELVFNMSAPHEGHLNRLLLSLIRSDEFLRRHIDTLQFRSLGILTTCLSKFPEIKAYRGIYRQTERKTMKDGTYKIRYKADRTIQTYQEVIDEWLTKYSLKKD